jgi:type I restriction enzyme, R subunit
VAHRKTSKDPTIACVTANDGALGDQHLEHFKDNEKTIPTMLTTISMNMSATSFWSADGRPMSAAQFMQSLYGTLPEFFADEDELRRLLSLPDTRKSLLTGLAEKGFGKDTLREIQICIKAENSDLFDVLAYVAYAAEPISRAQRAQAAKAATAGEFTDKQRAFVDFVLAQYVSQGVDELDADKLPPLLKLRYRNALKDAIAELGQPEQIRAVFVGMQRYLYG